MKSPCYSMKSIVVILAFVLMASFASTLGVDIETSMNGEVNNFIIETRASATSSFDSYDVEVPDYPDTSYAQLSSIVSGKNLMLDSFEEETDRSIPLVFEIGAGINNSLPITFSWDASEFSDYSAQLKDHGSNSSRTALLTTVDMDGGNSYFSDASGYSTRYYTMVLDYNEPTVPVDGGTGGGSGGGGGGGEVVVSNLAFDPTELGFNIVVGGEYEAIVSVTNLADFALNITISQNNLDDLLTIENRKVEFSPGEIKELKFLFKGPNVSGIYAGSILIGGNEILVSANVRTIDLLFDAMITIPDSLKKLSANDALQAQVVLIPMVDDLERMDVTLNYVIRDFEGNIYLIESETILVDSQKSFKKTFNVNNLVNGNYLVGLELVYPGGIATSSSHFSIVSGRGYIIEISILGGIIVAILTLLIFWRINLIDKRVKGSKKK